MADTVKPPMQTQVFGQGVPQKIMLIGLSLVASCASAVFMKLSQVNGKYQYSVASLVLCTEFTKFAMSFVLLGLEGYALMGPDPNAPFVVKFRTLVQGAVNRYRTVFPMIMRKESVYFGVPALCYMVNNNIEFEVLKYMPPAMYQTLNNLKILTTGVLVHFFLGRKLRNMQWAALMMLMFGAMLAQTNPSSFAASGENLTYGLLLLVPYCFISAFAGVFSELMMKKNFNDSIHMQNGILYTFGFVFNLLWYFQDKYYYNPRPDAHTRGFLDGFNMWSWALVFSFSVMGMAISGIMKHADNIVKVFANAGAMMFSTLVSWQLFNFYPGPYFLAAVATISASIYLYNNAPSNPAPAVGDASGASGVSSSSDPSLQMKVELAAIDHEEALPLTSSEEHA